MIQRIQTIWFIVAAACAFATFKCAFYSGSIDATTPSAEFNAQSNLLITILTSGIALFSLVLIFLYKNRKQQLKLSIVNLIASLVLIGLYFWRIKLMFSASVTLFAVFTFAIPVFLFLATRAIWKDEKLVKSVDRLR